MCYIRGLPNAKVCAHGGVSSVRGKPNGCVIYLIGGGGGYTQMYFRFNGVLLRCLLRLANHTNGIRACGRRGEGGEREEGGREWGMREGGESVVAEL